MKFLLEINALIALAYTSHVHHSRMIAWYKSIQGTNATLYTGAITELGFARVSVQIGLQDTVTSACTALARLKDSSKLRFSLLNDDIGIERLPAYVQTPGHITDGHLLELARHHSARLATVDKGIPGALLIP